MRRIIVAGVAALALLSLTGQKAEAKGGRFWFGITWGWDKGMCGPCYGPGPYPPMFGGWDGGFGPAPWYGGFDGPHGYGDFGGHYPAGGDFGGYHPVGGDFDGHPVGGDAGDGYPVGGDFGHGQYTQVPVYGY